MANGETRDLDLDAVIVRFYEAFENREPEIMAHCYHPDAQFSDPVFQDLRGPQVMTMWRALIGRSRDLKVELLEHDAELTGEGIGKGRALWRARYTFGATGRPVVNEIDARMRFEDGLIREHRDSFPFWRWSRQALGPVGLALGWTPFLRSRIRRYAARLL